MSLATTRKFDSIYSNKVLHHLPKSDIHRSFSRQKELLTGGGLLLHSFWFGHKEKAFHGLHFAYYTEEELLDIIGAGFDLVTMERYQEIEEDDSFYMLLRKTEA